MLFSPEYTPAPTWIVALLEALTCEIALFNEANGLDELPVFESLPAVSTYIFWLGVSAEIISAELLAAIFEELSSTALTAPIDKIASNIILTNKVLLNFKKHTRYNFL